MFRQKADADAVSGAEAHQERAARDVPEADDVADRVDGESEADLSLHFDDDRLPLLGEVGALCGDEQGIEMLLHRSPSFRFRRLFIRLLLAFQSFPTFRFGQVILRRAEDAFRVGAVDPLFSSRRFYPKGGGNLPPPFG